MKRVTCLVMLLAAAVAATAGPGSGSRACTAGPPGVSPGTSQVVTVLAADAHATTASMQLWGRAGGCWRPAGGPWRAWIGFAGLSTHHVEGDGTTPVGAFALGPVLYGVAPDPGVRYPYHRLVCGDWWDEDPASPGYNTLRHVPCGTGPSFAGSSEALWRSTSAYAHFAFVEYNAAPAVPGRGSAIFIHAELGHPTNGCISLPPGELVTLLRWLRPASRPLVVIGTASGISRS